MKTLKTYSIPFKGLKLGKHQFDYEITDSFFNEFEYSLVKKGKLDCQVELEKQETMLILDFKINGVVDRSCDRCLSEFPETVNVQERQIVKFGEAGQEETDDEIMFLKPHDYELDLSGLIYEYINLAMPLISVCNDEGNTPFCDQEMLDKLNKLSGTEEEEENTEPDPRWAVLKNIK
ncbi:YceD family protein [Mucilaginibacter arboris]|uniref:DUF177 domain-containing protein n=1 Tax=Mucilaginibacter arboris TaxID=2682090 RepID=A0A7K1SRL1_9SPHI|nr:DUF177 domain-containing protein [Mucilaginibacter arboris]MVN19945.1 DUF177 domain-containing protein [Mucilaginibacter arboris]